MYKKISKILICALILVLAVGAVSAMESDTVDDVAASDVADDVVAVSEDEIDPIAVEDAGDDIIGACEEEVIAVSEDADAVAVSEDADADVVAVSEEKEDTVAVSENGGAVGIDEGKSPVSLKVSDDSDKLSGYGSYKYKVFNLAKFKFPYKYINTKYQYLPAKMKKVYEKRLLKFNKKLTRKLQKIKNAGWYASGDPTYTIVKRGKNAIITYRLACYKYV